MVNTVTKKSLFQPVSPGDENVEPWNKKLIGILVKTVYLLCYFSPDITCLHVYCFSFGMHCVKFLSKYNHKYNQTRHGLLQYRKGSSQIYLYCRNHFTKNQTDLVSTTTRWFICANMLYSFGEIIGQIIDLFLIGYIKCCNNSESRPALYLVAK